MNAIKYTIKFFLLAIFFIFPVIALASSTDGTIDSTYKYAWGENIGWLNFGCSSCNVHITDSGLTGYAWSANYGWINLNPSTSGVKNNNQGTLSGYAWGENLGWINFSGVTINSSGEFTGYTTINIDNSQISFNCSNTNSCSSSDFKVKTDWRPRSIRPACNNSSDDDGDGKTDYPADPGCSSLDDTDETNIGGGGLPPGAYNPPAPPFSLIINDNTDYTTSRNVVLKLQGGPDAQKMAISNFSDFRDAGQEPYTLTKTWDLCKGFVFCPEGEYTVYAKFYTQWGYASAVISDSIIYKIEVILPEEKIPPEELPPSAQKPTVQPTVPIKPIAKKPPKPLIEKITEILKPIEKLPKLIELLLPEFLKPKPPEVKPPEVPIEELVPKQAPLAFWGGWRLLSYSWQRLPFEKFVLAPLPKEFRKLAEKFPELEKTLGQVGINKLIDVEKLKTVKLTLPGLTERVGLPTAKVEPGKFALPQGVPIANLSLSTKQKLPAEIVFAKTGGELIDFNIALSVTEKGEPQQKINTISGKPLQLVVKPDKPVKSVKGYVVFKSKTPRPTSFQLPFNSLLASLIFANPVFAKTQEKPVRVEEKLVLLEFEYTDPDGDGIYTAEIQAPVVEGEYEIITVMDFEDPALGKKEVRLTTVIDPEGYLYEKDGDKETRIPGAIVSIYWLNPETKQYELWPAKEYQQENPQTTDVRGTYSFLVPEGYYYLKAEAPGYLVYDGKSFQVKEGSGIHINIELKTKYWWLKIVDWKTILLIIVILLLVYNFYKDRIREKLLRKND